MKRPYAHTRFHAQTSWEEWPYLAMAGVETRQDPAYRLLGRQRPDRPHCVFQFTLAGTGWFRDAAGDHELPVGTGFLCDALDPAVEYGYPRKGSEPWRYVFATMTGTLVYAQVRSLIERHGALWTLPVETPVIQRLIGLGGAGGRREMEQPAFVGYQLVAELLSALLAVMGQATGASAGSDLLRRVRACVKNGAHGPLQVGELALMVGVTREHLTRVFRHQLGMTPAQYLARQRMLQACDWLRDTPLSVKEVAFRLGFSAPHHLVRMFRRVLGTTPRQFRETGAATPVL
jgi:AraC-like DNA-binding protein